MSVEQEETPSTSGRSRTRLVVLAVAVVVAVTVAVVASRPLWAPTPEAQLIDALGPGDEGNGGGGAICGPVLEDFGALADLLPNTLYRAPDGTEHPQTEVVMAGRFTTVEPGVGRVVSDDDGPNDRAVPFDDPSAMYRTVHARLVVDTVVAGEVQVEPVLVGFVVRGVDSDWDHLPTLEVAREGLPALGRVVVFLTRGSARYAYDPSLYAVEHHYSGSDLGYAEYPLLGQVGADGRLEFPMLPPGEAERLTSSTPTLDALQASGRAPVRVIDAGDCLSPLDPPT